MHPSLTLDEQQAQQTTTLETLSNASRLSSPRLGKERAGNLSDVSRLTLVLLESSQQLYRQRNNGVMY
jgi:hypothetical protein